MARLARLIIPGMVHHVYLSGNNSQEVFVDDEDRLAFLKSIREAAHQYGVDVHAYALLAACVHLLVTPKEEKSLAGMIQWVGRKYVRSFNDRHGRSGTLWEGRFRTSVVDASWVMRCCRFIERQPVLHGLVNLPENYPWSSYCHHVGIRPDPLVRDHGAYWNLGNTPFAREMAYKALFEYTGVDDTRLTESLKKGWPVGADAFIRRLEETTHRVFRMGKVGRPPKDAEN